MLCTRIRGYRSVVYSSSIVEDRDSIFSAFRIIVTRSYSLFFFFFFQAEDGIRDADVTGVQTCALPILLPLFHVHGLLTAINTVLASASGILLLPKFDSAEVLQHFKEATVFMGVPTHRSEERRVGKECRSRWWA